MERNEYLRKCQLISTFPDGMCRVKKVPTHLQIKYRNILYYPQSYVMDFRNGQPVNLAILHEVGKNCIVTVPLDEV